MYLFPLSTFYWRLWDFQEPEDSDNDQPGPASEKGKKQVKEASNISSWDPEPDENEAPNVGQVAQAGDSLLALVNHFIDGQKVICVREGQDWKEDYAGVL